MKGCLIAVSLLALLSFSISSCTPALVTGVAAGCGYVGYKLGSEGYSIKITKPVKGKKVNDSSTKTDR